MVLFQDSTLGNYQYTFENKDAQDLPLTLERNNNGNYQLFNQYWVQMHIA